jgi:Cytosolic domain of 10TM putative phosphate transporter/Late exocytosis, associated with Golgi transport
MDWIRVLRAISDEEMKAICGTDAALFIIFVRYASYFFALSALFGFAALVPMYVTGDPAKIALVYDVISNQKITLLLITIVNCTKLTYKVAMSFSFILIFFTGGVFIFIFHFWKRSLRWRFKELKPGQTLTDVDIA